MSDSDVPETRPSHTRLILLALAVGLALGVGWWFELERWLDVDALRAWIESAGPFAPLLLIGVMATAVVVAPLPSLPIDIAAGLAFGWFWGGLYAALGATLGAVISFQIARALGRDHVARLFGGHVNLCEECADHVLLAIVFGSRLIPAISFDVISYGAGLTRMRVLPFAVATFVGTLPLTFLYTAFGPAVWSDGWRAMGVAALVLLLLFGLTVWLERRGWIDPASWPHRRGVAEESP